jgi:hypothetical protein
VLNERDKLFTGGARWDTDEPSKEQEKERATGFQQEYIRGP